MTAIHSALNLVRAFRRSYLALNALYYGLVAAAMVVYAAFNRPLQQELMENILIGIKHSLHLYLLVVLQLAAIYEALVAIVVIPWLR